MDLSSRTVLITGGGSGIGLGLARRLRDAGSRVIVCGRRADRLREVEAAYRGIATRVCDLTLEADRLSLVAWAVAEYPTLDMLVNNAGIQRRVDLAAEKDASGTRAEIAINLEAPIHLCSLAIPHLRRRPSAAIVNITSGLAFTPLARVPVYCATKAAFHSFTLSLRKQLEGTGIEVIEIVPPAVDTDLGGPGLHKFGVSVDALLDFVMPRLAGGEVEIAYGFAQQSSRASREELDRIFERMNRPE
jgi:uncharacterized oxidoreductase